MPPGYPTNGVRFSSTMLPIDRLCIPPLDIAVIGAASLTRRAYTPRCSADRSLGGGGHDHILSNGKILRCHVQLFLVRAWLGVGMRLFVLYPLGAFVGFCTFNKYLSKGNFGIRTVAAAFADFEEIHPTAWD